MLVVDTSFLTERSLWNVGRRGREIDSQFNVLKLCEYARKILSRVPFFRDTRFFESSLSPWGPWSMVDRRRVQGKKETRISPLPSPLPTRWERRAVGKKTRRSREAMPEYERQLQRRAKRHFGTMSPRVLENWVTSLAPGNRATVSLPSQSSVPPSSSNLSLSWRVVHALPILSL